MNDSLHAIKDDPDFGRKLYEAILHRDHPADVMAKGGGTIHTNAAVVIETHHADFEVLVRVGGNRGEVVR
jgi:hypothetical protein